MPRPAHVRDLHEPPEEDLLPGEALVESHLADAMPSAHWHDHLELNWLSEGRMDYLMNGRRVTLLPRRLGLFWAAIGHQTIAVEPEQRLYCAYLPIGAFLGLPVDPALRGAILGGALVQGGAETPEDGIRLSAMAAGWDGAGEALRRLWLDELLLRLRRFALEPREAADLQAPAAPGGRGVAHVERMTAFVQDRLGEPIGVAEVAAAAGLHPTSAQAAFRRVLGMSVAQYLRRQRLGLAMRLLAETDEGIAQIAHRAGYSSVSRLYDAFQDRLGRTPRRYRAEMRGR